MASEAARSKRAAGYLALAYTDYVAARLLLLEGLLIQAAPLASTALEKLLKAALLAGGHKVSKAQHLCAPLVHQFKDAYPGLLDNSYEDFLKFLEKAYRLRYAQADGEGFCIVLNQYRTLIHLDRLVQVLNEPFKFSRGEQQVPTPFGSARQSEDPLLTKGNTALRSDLLPQIMAGDNRVIEVGMGGKFRNLVVQYQTKGVSDSGSFLKKPNFTSDVTQFLVTFG